MVLLLTINSIMGFAQEENVNNKMSGATHFFIKDRDAKNVSTPTIKLKDITPVSDLSAPEFVGKRLQPLYAKTDTIDGKAYISSFVRLDNENNTYAIEAKGAIVQCRFSNGLITALIPVDSIESVAAIADVKKVSVARRMSMMGNKARQATNTDDVLTQSTDAIAAGLSNKYDGSGVVLGVIDTGIDFNHIAFKDANGNSRIKTAYVYNGSSAKEYSGSSITSTLTDDNTEDHGTHTSSTAGGSSVIFSGSEGSSTWGSTVTVTTDHANATFGGMAPGADLYLAGINGLADTYIANAFQKICNYADGQGKPVVVSNSWGMSVGPRDGTGDIADVVNTYFGDSHPNHICLFAASNDAGNGGMYVSGSASSSSPLGTVIKSNYQDKYFVGVIADAWTRTSSSATMMCKVMTINKSTGAIVSTNTVTPTTSGASTGISGLYAIKQTSSSGHAGCYLYAYGSGSGYITSSYYIAVQFYPSSGSATVDVWSPGGYTYFDNSPSISGYTWQLGTDDSSVSDEATIKNSIAIGAYVTKNSLYDHNGTSRSLTSSYPNIGDIAYFSSYQVEGKGASQELLPWITAPGATIVAGVNHNHTSGDYSYMNDNMASYGMYRVNNNTSYPYGSMEGTSMATPVAAGIVALWLQAAHEVGKEMTVNDIKTVMKETAINDSYTTTGSNASHFGNGKIDALAGIKYILGASATPTIKAEPTAVEFTDCYATMTYTQEINVSGTNLEGNISVAKSGNAVFNIDKTTIQQTDGTASATITVTYKPTTAGIHTGTLTLTSSNAESVTISLNGTAEPATPTIISDKSELTFASLPGYQTTQTVNVTGRFLTQNVTATLSDASGVFTIDKNSLAIIDNGAQLTVNFLSAEEGFFSGTLTLSSAGATAVTIALSATAKNGGNATDAYLNIANYQTIDDAGWRTTLVNNLYQYTEYEDDEVAWLTLPVYGAYVSANCATNSNTIGSGHPQTWINTNVNDNNNRYAGTTWNANNPLLGSDPYFTSATARAMGYNATGNTTLQTFSFFVTNATAAKLYLAGQSKTTSSYPASLKVYECSINSDGTLSPAADAVASKTNSNTSGSYILTADELDAAKIYMVEAATYCSYLYEIGFQTPIEVDKTPTILTSTEDVNFDKIYATTEETQTFTLRGKYLEGPISITLSDESSAFSVDKTSVSADEAANSVEVTITFHPTEAGNFTGSITLSSEGAEPVSIMLSGEAEAAIPTILTDKESLSFSANVDSEQSQTLTVSGRFLSSEISLALTDQNGVFSVSPTILSADELTDGATITVTFLASEEGDFTGTLTLTSEGAETVSISLSATANDGGTASDAYLNIAKYVTIDDAGWNTTYVNTLYKYTEYEEDEIAWLTLPMYGAMVGAKYSINGTTLGSGHPQTWIESNVSNTNQCGSTTWEATDEYSGSNYYFTSISAKAVGTNSTSSRSEKTMTFYVTNTTAVKFYGNHNGSTNYPTKLAVYECTVSNDGTVTAATSVTNSASATTSTGKIKLSLTDLDKTKVYKVVVSQARGYMYEIAFQTPLKKKLVGDVNRDGSVTIADVTAIVNIVTGKATDYNNYDYEAANVNGDIIIDTADVIELVNIILERTIQSNNQ